MVKNDPSSNKKSVRLEQLYYEGFEMKYVERTTILLVLEGRMELLLDGNNIQVLEGELYILNSNEMVGIEVSESNLVLIVELDMTKDILLGKKIRLEQPMSNLYYQDLYDQLTELLSFLYIETVEAKEGYSAFVSGYMNQIYGLILRYLPVAFKAESEENEEISTKILDVMTFLNKNYRENYSLDDLSAHFYLSKYYLAHSFREQVGTTIGKYIEEVRLLNAVHALNHTNNTVADIAEASGFVSSRSFIESFKKKRGMTPTQYRKKEGAKKPTKKQLSRENNYLELFSKYIRPQVENAYARMEVVEETLDLSIQDDSTFQIQYVLKMFRENQSKKVKLIAQNTQQRMIAVDHIMDKMKIKDTDADEVIDFTLLKNELDLLMNYQLIPYLQISVYDYEKYLKRKTLISFKEIISRLKYFLESHYYSLPEWRIEFRPYYEYDETGELCEPIREVIALFKDTCQLVIHMPEHPVNSDNDQNESVTVEVINDSTQLQTFSLSHILNELRHPRNLEQIQQNNNMLYQGQILSHLEQLGQDAYYQQFDELIYASFMIWSLFNVMKDLKQKMVTPLTLDGKPLFYYFEEKLAQKIALISPEGLYTDSWYIFQFISHLYGEIVFKNDYCLVTRRGAHYRMLFIHSDNFMDNLSRIREDREPKTSYKQPTALIRILLKGLSGTYRIAKEEITPNMRQTQKKELKIESNVKLLKEDVDYLNQIRQPSRQIHQENIKGDLLLEEEIPLLGVRYIEMTKIK